MRHRNSKTEDEEKGEFVVIEDKLFKEISQTNLFSSNIFPLLTLSREAWQRSVLATEEDS